MSSIVFSSTINPLEGLSAERLAKDAETSLKATKAFKKLQIASTGTIQLKLDGEKRTITVINTTTNQTGVLMRADISLEFDALHAACALKELARAQKIIAEKPIKTPPTQIVTQEAPPKSSFFRKVAVGALANSLLIAGLYTNYLITNQCDDTPQANGPGGCIQPLSFGTWAENTYTDIASLFFGEDWTVGIN